MKILKQATYSGYVLVKSIKIYPNQHSELLGSYFTEDSGKNKKSLELVSR